MAGGGKPSYTSAGIVAESHAPGAKLARDGVDGVQQNKVQRLRRVAPNKDNASV